jgi:hypothetical protein
MWTVIKEKLNRKRMLLSVVWKIASLIIVRVNGKVIITLQMENQSGRMDNK